MRWRWIYYKRQMLKPDVLLLWSCPSPGASVALIHPESVSEVVIRSQNPSSKSHLLYLEPSTENTFHFFMYSFIFVCVTLQLFCVLE